MRRYSAREAAAEWFGGAVSKDTLLREYHDHRLDGARVRGKILFTEEDLQAYEKRCRMRPARRVRSKAPRLSLVGSRSVYDKFKRPEFQEGL